MTAIRPALCRKPNRRAGALKLILLTLDQAQVEVDAGQRYRAATLIRDAREGLVMEIEGASAA